MTQANVILRRGTDRNRRHFLKQTMNGMAAVTVLGGIGGATAAIIQPQHEITWMSATQIAATIRRREISASVVVAHFLARIQQLHHPQSAPPAINAEAALAQAGVVDSMIARGTPGYGPLLGVPIVVDTRADDIVVQRLRAAGAIVIGTTAAGANAVGAGLIPLAIASDGANARISAASGGVFSGHIPMVSAALCETIGVQAACGYEPGGANASFPLARDIHDIELSVQLLAGLPGYDRVARDEAALTLTSSKDNTIEGLRFAWLANRDNGPNKQSDNLMHGVARNLARSGARIAPTDFPWQVLRQSHVALERRAAKAIVNQPKVTIAFDQRHASWQRLNRLLDDHDVLASAAMLGASEGSYPSSTLISWLGFPTITIPCGLQDKPPQALQLTARAGDEQQLYRAAAAFSRHASKHMRSLLG